MTKNDAVDQALESLVAVLTTARLPQESPIDGIKSRIQALRTNPSAPDATAQVSQIRADLMDTLLRIEQSSAQTAGQQRVGAVELSPEQKAMIKQRFDACLQYMAHRDHRAGKPEGGDLAWLARLRV